MVRARPPEIYYTQSPELQKVSGHNEEVSMGAALKAVYHYHDTKGLDRVLKAVVGNSMDPDRVNRVIKKHLTKVE